MNSVALPPAEYWFYRVYSELTLALLHQVNNELTGVVFLTELIQDDLEAGLPVAEKSRDLHASIEKVIRLTKKMMDTHLPLSSQPEDACRSLGDLVREALPFLRLVVPKSVSIFVEPPPFGFPEVAIPEGEFQMILAAIGLLLAPLTSRSGGELKISVTSSPPSLVFHPDYPVGSLPAQGLESEPSFQALSERLSRLGGGIALLPVTGTPMFEGLRLTLRPPAQ